MGLRSAAFICQKVTNMVSFILGAHYVLHIFKCVDDLTSCDVNENTSDAYAILGEVFDNCGLGKSLEKTALPSNSLVFLGILFDTVSCILLLRKG